MTHTGSVRSSGAAPGTPSGADDVPRPGLVLGSWGEVGNHDLHGLKLLVLRRNGAHLVGDLVACHGNILAFNAVGRKLQLIITHTLT